VILRVAGPVQIPDVFSPLATTAPNSRIGCSMIRKLNPKYMRRIMSKQVITGLEVVFLLSREFGVTDHRDRLRDEDAENGDCVYGENDEDRFNYKGWTKPSQLYCVKCRHLLTGVPRTIVLRNRCDYCGSQLYPDNYDERLDFLGFAIYRDRVTRYMGIAVRHFPKLIEGFEHLRRNGQVETGFDKDHLYSVREAFEENVAEQIVSSPPNLRVISRQANMAKGRKSGWTQQALGEAYQSFVERHPEWMRLVRESDGRQPTFVLDACGRRYLTLERATDDE